MTATLGDLIERHGFDVHDHINRDLEIPVHAGLQAQGDLFIVPVSSSGYTAGKDIPAEGVPVIEAIGDGHEHRLFASVPGTARIRMLGSGQDIAYMECTEPVYSAHQEHAYSGIAAGSYVLRRQREQADQERLVAD